MITVLTFVQNIWNLINENFQNYQNYGHEILFATTTKIKNNNHKLQGK